jgi:hypothetical protein
LDTKNKKEADGMKNREYRWGFEKLFQWSDAEYFITRRYVNKEVLMKIRDRVRMISVKLNALSKSLK